MPTPPSSALPAKRYMTSSKTFHHTSNYLTPLKRITRSPDFRYHSMAPARNALRAAFKPQIYFLGKRSADLLWSALACLISSIEAGDKPPVLHILFCVIKFKCMDFSKSYSSKAVIPACF